MEKVASVTKRHQIYFTLEAPLPPSNPLQLRHCWNHLKEQQVLPTMQQVHSLYPVSVTQVEWSMKSQQSSIVPTLGWIYQSCAISKVGFFHPLVVPPDSIGGHKGRPQIRIFRLIGDPYARHSFTLLIIKSIKYM